jgi:hypothetical protein
MGHVKLSLAGDGSSTQGISGAGWQEVRKSSGFGGRMSFEVRDGMQCCFTRHISSFKTKLIPHSMTAQVEYQESKFIINEPQTS